MKRIFFLALLALLSFTGFSQPVSADLFLSNAHFEDLSGNSIDPNLIAYNQVVKIKVNIGNLSLSENAPAGHFRIRIGLGAGMIVNPGFTLATAPMSSYFAWSFDGGGAQPQIVGTSIAALPASTVGTAEFELKAATAVTSTVSYNLLIANPIGTTTPLSDPLPDNNVASGDYTVAGALTATINGQNISCYGVNNGSITIAASGGFSPYNYTIVNTATSASSSQTSANQVVFSGLSPATYNITVTDAVNTVFTGSATLMQPASALVNAFQSKTNILCNGASTGAISVQASGGTGSIAYAITAGPTVNTTGQTTGNFTGLSAGTYDITATDANGCTSTVSGIQLTQPTPLAFASTSSTDVNCFGAMTGTITVSASGGAGGYSYTLSGTGSNTSGDATGAYTGLPAGTYTVTVKDVNNCTKTTGPITVNQPSAALSYSTPVTTNINCYGQSTGAISVSASGGTPPYGYVISGPTVNTTGAGSGNFTGLSAGTYSIAITDNKGCTTTVSGIVLSQPGSALSALLQMPVTNVACYGGSTGSFTVNSLGGTPGYSFAITSGPVSNVSGATTGTFSGLIAGTYAVTVTDSKGCTTVVNNITVSQPAAALSIQSTSKTDVACYGQSTGTITVNAAGGTPNYSYAITTGTGNTSGNGNGQYTGLAAGTYVITVTDANSCTVATNPITLSQPSQALSFSSVSSTDVACYGNSTGTVTVSAAGGTPGYTYLLTGTGANSSGNGNGQYTGLPAGSYTVTVTDAANCTATTNVTVNQPAAALSYSTPVTTNINCHGGSTGSISITASGGTSPYSYALSSGPTNNTGNFTGLPAGMYSVSITDNKSCTVTVSNIQLTQPTTPLTNSSVTRMHNTCHGGIDGKITLAVTGGTAPYAYALSGGTTTNNTGDGNGIYTGLAASTYNILVTDAKGCTITVSGIVINEPSSTTPDVILSVADYTDNFFPANGSSVTLIYQVSEIAGNPALNDIIRITKQTGYTFSLPNISSITVGSGMNAVVYPLDNSRWVVNASNPLPASFFEIAINSGQQIDCQKSVYIAIQLTRTTNNKSVFTLTSLARNVTNEMQTGNNSTTIVLVGQ